jgi:alanine-synthesizing transaminase
MMFSRRLPADPSPNALSIRLEAMRREGIAFIDLTESNPTRAGVAYPGDLLASLGDAAALRYDPDPFGLSCAREAVAADYMRRGANVDPARIVLTASTSEAYSWLFKLLCNPRDRVLVPRPSYPLFEHLTRLEAIVADAYDLEYHGTWSIDMDSVNRVATADARALLVVSPNNPTGSFLKRAELEHLTRLCRDRQLALIVDEVFVDYELAPAPDRVTDVAAVADVLAFTLGGLSKSVGLPQVKLGWIVVGGAAADTGAALRSLELISDSYLSVSTPVQVAASRLIAAGIQIRDQISTRVRRNLQELQAFAVSYRACELLNVEAGWYAVLRIPATRSEDDFVLELLDRERVLVYPGYFFDFAREAYIVVSLLPPPAVFVDAVARVLHFAVTSV